MGCAASSDAAVSPKDSSEGIGAIPPLKSNHLPICNKDKALGVEESKERKESNGTQTKEQNVTTQGENQKDHPVSARATENGAAKSTSTSPTIRSTESSTSTPVVSEEHKEDAKKRMMKSLKDRQKSNGETEAMVLETVKKSVENRVASLEESDTAKKALMGDIDVTCPSPAKIVRIFTSSTFTDTKNERNMLMRHAYPKVKEHCRRKGYEFQVVDMRWGVRDEATDDHMGTELCLKELKLCKEVSTGPNFVTFLSQKYGYTPFPRVIEANELQTILDAVEDEESKQLLIKWYKLDNNAVPPAYILSPISSQIPEFLSPDGEKKKKAKQIWWDESDKMQYALDVTATKVFDKERARKYIMSVTETEIQDAMLNSENPSKHFIWFKRDIEDLEKQENSYLLSRFLECTGPEEKCKKSRDLLKQLKEEILFKKLSNDKIVAYNVKWNPTSGINPDDDKQHKDYLENLCKDFVTKLTEMIDAGVAERARTDDTLVEECCQHIRFCQSKCEGFQGRHDTLKLIRTYVQGSSSEPLVLHGTSGTGKTSIMAMAAMMMKQWTSNQPAVVLRFLGTSPDSSSIMSLLKSLTSQIRRVYKLPPPPATDSNLDDRIKEFEEALELGKPDKPLVLMLDSLDQLDPAYDARKLGWLVTQLAPGTKMIVSTLPEPIYDCFPALQAMLPSEFNFVSVPVLDNSDVKSIFDNWLTMRQRRLTDHQMTTVLDAFKKCPTPLFLKLSFEEAATWTSFMPADKTVLQDTVRAGIDFLFQKLEKTHGPMLVSRALGYLTNANSGATEAELEDILSCDDDVLNDVYMYWTPPIRRLPPLLLVRIRTDLSQYLVERGADGVRVIYWYHRQFIEAAEARYCSDKTTNRLIHERLADFFHGTWANGKKKPYTNAKGEGGEEDRHLSQQPLKFGANNYNMRTLNNLPYHRINAGQVDLLKDQCLANPTFLIHKFEAAPFYSVLRDYAMANQMFPDDDLIKEVLQALHLSEKALTTDARQLIPQMIQRLDDSSAMHKLLERCKEYPSTYILPSKLMLEKPGGQLVHSIPAHKQWIHTMDMTFDCKLIVTACPFETVSIWDVKEAKKKRDVKGMEGCRRAFFCNYDKWLAIGLREKLIIQNLETGVSVMTVPFEDFSFLTTFCLLGKGRTIAMQFMGPQYKLTDLLADPSKDKIPLQSHPEGLTLNTKSNPTGSDNYLAVTSDDVFFITVYDLNARSFRPSFRGFPEIPDEVNPGDPLSIQVIGPVISRDETHLIYTNGHDGEVVFADFDGNRLRSIPPNDTRFFQFLNLTPDGNILYISDRKTLRFYDTRTLQEVGTLEQQRALRMAVTYDAVNVITASEDGNLRIWDRSRADQSEDDAFSRFTTKLYYFDSAHVLNNPRYVLLCGPSERDGRVYDNLHLEVYDVFTNTIVGAAEMTGGMDRNRLICQWAFMTKNEREVILVLCDRQIVRVDLQTMTIVKHYIGFTTMVTMCEETEEIFCTTRGAMHMKLYDRNGDFLTVMKAGQTQRITNIHINKSGTVGCALSDEESLMLYDITNRKHMYNIDAEKLELLTISKLFAGYLYLHYQYWGNREPDTPDLKCRGGLVLCYMYPKADKRNTGNYVGFLFGYRYTLWINTAGTRLIFSSDSKIAGVPVMDDIDHMVLWDIQASKEICKLCDVESQAMYVATKSKMDIGLSLVYELDSTRLLSTHRNDYVIRVWNIHTGEMIAQMRGHISPAGLELSEKSPYICSYASYSEETCVRLWDKTTYDCVASFTLDIEVSNITWSADGKFLISKKDSTPPDVTTWKVYHGHDHMADSESDYPQIFSQKEGTMDTIVFKLYKRGELEMEGDPDSDPEELSDGEQEEADDAD